MGEYRITSADHWADGYIPELNSDGTITLFDNDGNIEKIVYPDRSGLEAKVDLEARKALPKEDKKYYSGNTSYY
ncbi:MAG TPA: hypothetical protein VEC16_07010 [Alphaproteobacteria bacterium]|nr:hypothetical protein [Alphaproteobacteria bacterium]